MSTTPSNRSRRVKKSPATTPQAGVKTDRAKSAPKKKSIDVGSVIPKPPRLCAGCQGKISLSARYCRHCGVALSKDVPVNPYLPPVPKPWRPSRIPKHRPAQTPMVQTAQVQDQPGLVQTDPAQALTSMSSHATPSSIAKDVHVKTTSAQAVADPETVAPQPWDPVPELEQRMAKLKAMHDLLRPQLARADLLKRRLRLP